MTPTLTAPHHRRRRSIAHTLLMLIMLAAIGCKTPHTQEKKFIYTPPTSALQEAGFPAWAAGDEDAALKTPQASSAEASFLQAEFAFWDGDVERALDLYLSLIQNHPSHPISRFAAARLLDLHDDTLNYHQRVLSALHNIPFKDTHPLTALSLSLISQQIALNTWYTERSPTPLDVATYGLPQHWNTSPRLSPLRLTHLDTPFPPETDLALKDAYLSPSTAEDSKENYTDTSPYVASGINLRPKLPLEGIYYLETFATVQADTPQVYWLYANFAGGAKLFIDGQEVITRYEDDYLSGKRLRRITLSPGTHRILVKLSNSPNSRDWLDLSFLHPEATLKGGSLLTFSHTPPPSYEPQRASIELLSQPLTPLDLEPLPPITSPQAAQDADDLTLYLTALASHYDRHAPSFDLSHQELSQRYPQLAALAGLKHYQVQTLWEVPSKLREATALSELRRAHQLHSTSTRYLVALGKSLQKLGKDREGQTLLERAKDLATTPKNDTALRLKHVEPLAAWASFLEDQGWSELAEQAWHTTLDAAPEHCPAARALQRLSYQRKDFRPPQAFTPAHAQCPSLEDAWIAAQPDAHPLKLQIAKRHALRYPHDPSTQLAYAKLLDANTQPEAAYAWLLDAATRIPDSLSLTAQLAERDLLTHSQDAAIKRLDDYQARYGASSWLFWHRATLLNQQPLSDLLQDGVKTALAIAQKDPVSPENPAEKRLIDDEAFYAIDFAAQHYLPDGSSLTLTHTLVRVMTKNAIDRFGEVELSDSSRVLFARTIKQDGSVQVPSRVDGKDTLSMPGLAEGDFVELAYIDFNSSNPSSKTRRISTKFYFQMQDISSLRSEFVIINPRGEFLRRNQAPQAETWTYQGLPATRFLATNSPKPRAEPYSVSVEERLPWVQLLNSGLATPDAELGRLAIAETLRDATKMSHLADRKIAQWLDALPKEAPPEQRLQALFYLITQASPSPSRSLAANLSHGLLTDEFNPLIALLIASRRLGLQADLYLVKSSLADPTPHPLLDFNAYTEPMLRVPLPQSDRVLWLNPSSQDAIFDAIPHALLNQPALCITCPQATTDTLPASTSRQDRRDQLIKAALDTQGTLRGTIQQTYDGGSASYARQLLRERQEPSQRQKLIEALVADHIPGASITSYDIQNAQDPHLPITFIVSFEREQFALTIPIGLSLEAPIFTQNLASTYTTLPSRQSTLIIARPRDYRDRIEISLPAHTSHSLKGATGERAMKSTFGSYLRSTKVEQNSLIIDASISLPIQRVSPAQYKDLQAWAVAVEQSSALSLTLAP